MKVLYIHHSGTFGGSSKSLGIVIQKLVETGLEAHIICPPGKVVEYFKSITPHVHVIKHKAFSLMMSITKQKSIYFHYLRNYRKVLNIGIMRELILKIKPDLVHCNEWGLILVAKMAFKMGIPVVMHARTMGDKNYQSIIRIATRYINKYCSHLICITGSVDNFFKDVKNKSIIYNAVEYIPLANEFDKNKRVINFLSISALAKNKGVLEIVEAAKFFKNDKRVNIQIAGRVNSQPLKESIKDRLLRIIGITEKNTSIEVLASIKNNDLNNIDLLGHIDKLENVLKKADVVLAPMRLNAPPRTVFEGGMYEIPSILAMDDKVEDVVEDGVNGFLIEEESPNQLIEAMLKYVDNPSLRQQHGIEARKRFIINHNIDTIASKVLAIYKKVLTTQKGTP